MLFNALCMLVQPLPHPTEGAMFLKTFFARGEKDVAKETPSAKADSPTLAFVCNPASRALSDRRATPSEPFLLGFRAMVIFTVYS